MQTLSFKNLDIADDINMGLDFQVIADQHGVTLEQVEWVADQLDMEQDQE